MRYLICLLICLFGLACSSVDPPEETVGVEDTEEVAEDPNEDGDTIHFFKATQLHNYFYEPIFLVTHFAPDQNISLAWISIFPYIYTGHFVFVVDTEEVEFMYVLNSTHQVVAEVIRVAEGPLECSIELSENESYILAIGAEDLEGRVRSKIRVLYAP